MTYDLLVKGGTVVDPSQELNTVRDVALSDGKNRGGLKRTSRKRRRVRSWTQQI